jgi:phosphohistidine phosphatase SixA
MAADTLGMETANVIYDLHKDGIESYVVLMRHSARVIDTAENDAIMELTEEGRQAAYELGKALPPNALIRFYSSPIHRCVETSNLIEKGYLFEGEKTQTNTVMDFLYAFFAKDVLNS